MPDMVLFLLIVLALAATTGVLMTGLGGFAKGGEFNRRNGNKLMRWRIIAQAVSIALIMAFVFLRGL